MKKVIMFIIFSVRIVQYLHAQDIKFGVEGGINFMDILLVNPPYNTLNPSPTTGYHIGALVDVYLERFSLQSGLSYTTKGALNSTFKYFELPLSVLYHIPVKGVGSVFLGSGPYLGYGVSTPTPGIVLNDFGNSLNDVQNPDFGLNFLGGFCFNNGIFLNANYGLGLATLKNIGNYLNGFDENSPSINGRNRTFTISLGYFFGLSHKIRK
jgi:hypothetical protein